LKELEERLDHEEAIDSPSSPETLSVWGLAWPSIHEHPKKNSRQLIPLKNLPPRLHN
jgi:hypothetical protein